MVRMSTGFVFDIRRYSLQDGPGIRTAVFLKGCPLRCDWCHNPEGQSFLPQIILSPGRCIRCGACITACPHAAVERDGEAVVTNRVHCWECGTCVEACAAEARQVVGRELSVEQVMEAIERDRPFYEQSGGGVTFTGGEPLAQPRFLQRLLSACRAGGIHATVDTSGFTPWLVLDGIRRHVDLFLYDLKLVDDGRHRAFTGGSNQLILENLRRLSALGAKLVVRFPVIPGVNDDEESLRQSAAFLGSLPQVPPVRLVGYHHLASGKCAGLGLRDPMPNVTPPAPARLQEVARLLQTAGLEVHSA